MISRLLVADQALDERKLSKASQFLEGFIAAVNADSTLAASGMADTAEAIVDAIEPHVNNPGW
jgi:stalled ribosome rescue protein Dom34